jgi:hypothetical protein
MASHATAQDQNKTENDAIIVAEAWFDSIYSKPSVALALSAIPFSYNAEGGINDYPSLHAMYENISKQKKPDLNLKTVSVEKIISEHEEGIPMEFVKVKIKTDVSDIYVIISSQIGNKVVGFTVSNTK